MKTVKRMIDYGNFGRTLSDAVSDSNPDEPFAIVGANPVSINDFIVVATVNMHIQLNGNASTETSPFIPSNTPIRLRMFGTDSLSYVTAAGADDGDIWLTAVSS
jgi:hypothetical protein